jgi:NlpC/P60 family
MTGRVLLAGLLCLAATPLQAQGPAFTVEHFFSDPDATMYRLGLSSEFAPPVGTDLHVSYTDGRRGTGNLWGAGIDLSLFRSGTTGIYLAGGVDGGLVTSGNRTLWGAWSVGGGYEFFPFRGLSVSLESRYRQVSGGFNGIGLGVRIGYDRHGGGSASRSSPEPQPPPDPEEISDRLSAAGVPQDRARLIAGVVQTALDVMGMPYRWGDQGDEGFDCSGLIRYAYGQHGIVLPRRSADQAREGAQVERQLDALRSGDILTFATSGSDRVTHVGLYVGNGRFIHSASGGVQLSVLSPDDVSGRWWWRRWIGARRVVQ